MKKHLGVLAQISASCIYKICPFTFSQVLNGFPYPSVKRSGVSRALEGQATLPVLHLPMVKCGRCYGVHQVLPQRTVQDHLL